MKWFLLIGVLCGFLFSNSANAAGVQLQSLSYNCDSKSFPEERKILKDQYKKLYIDRDKLIEAAEEQGDSTSLKNADFCIAKTDLNQDGIEDIFLYSSFGTLTCGTLGCDTKIFFVSGDEKWDEVLSLHTYQKGISLAEIYQGYRVLVITMKVSCPCNKIIRPDGAEILDNTADRIFVYDKKKKEYRGIGIRTE